MRVTRALILTIGLWLVGAVPARADDLADFNAAVEAAWAHQRVALGYLRTGNVDLAAVEVERMAQNWGAVTSHGRPAAIKDKELYVVTLTDITTRIIAVRMMIDLGRPDVARDSLIAMRVELAKLRRDSGIVVLADCVLDANDAMDTLMTLKETRPDLAKPEPRADVLAKAARYRGQLERCDAISGPARTNGDFRRLIDGAQASLAQIPKAVETGDADLLYRLLIELRSFDNLLAIRFG